jgi:hypothetical protein
MINEHTTSDAASRGPSKHTWPRIPIAHSADSVSNFLDAIEQRRVPRRVSQASLIAGGFTAANDRELRGVFRLLGFLDLEHRPTELWRRYKRADRTKRHMLLQDAIRTAYQPLYQHVAEAHRRSDTELADVLATMVRTRSTCERALRTFRRLCTRAGLHYDRSAEPQLPPFGPMLWNNPRPALVFQLPPDASAEVYTAIFAAYTETFS